MNIRLRVFVISMSVLFVAIPRSFAADPPPGFSKATLRPREGTSPAATRVLLTSLAGDVVEEYPGATVDGATHLDGNVFLGANVLRPGKLYLWLDDPALWIYGMGTGIDFRAQGGQAHETLAARRMIQRVANPVAGEYIVVLADSVAAADVPSVAKQLVARHGGNLQKVWQYAVKGFFLKATEAEAVKMLRDRRVRHVEQNGATRSSDTQETDINPVTGVPTADNRMWHLDRIDDDPNDHEYEYCSTGDGVTVYVIDTGVMRFHHEFIAENIKEGYNAAEPDEDKARYPANDPCHGWPAYEPSTSVDYGNYKSAVLAAGHGTSVASLVAGQRTGVAKNAILVPVKVSRCDLYTAREWKTNHDYKAGELITVDDIYWKCIAGGRSTMRPSNTTPTLSEFTDGQLRWRKLGYNAPSENVRHWVRGTYGEKQYIVNAKGHVWKSKQAGTTGSTEPVWPDVMTAITDGTVIWENQGPQLVPQTTQMKIDGINWILSPGNPNPVNRSIATLSTYVVRGDPMMTGSMSFDEAILALIDAGVTVFASANNQDDDACNTSPAHLSRNNPDPARTSRWKVITVGGTMLSPDPDRESGEPRDARWICGEGDSDSCSPPIDTTAPIWTWNVGQRRTYIGTTVGSNKGPCVTLFAPAKNITSARMSGPNDYRNRLGTPDELPVPPLASGTSFSAPIAAGVAARFLEYTPAATVDDVYEALMNGARRNVLDAGTLESPDNVMLWATDVWIYRKPESKTVTLGETVSLIALASGVGELTYEW